MAVRQEFALITTHYKIKAQVATSHLTCCITALWSNGEWVTDHIKCLLALATSGVVSESVAVHTRSRQWDVRKE